MPQKLEVLAGQWFNISWMLISVEEVTKVEKSAQDYLSAVPSSEMNSLEDCALRSHLISSEIYEVN